jgi:hypothetical protein
MSGDDVPPVPAEKSSNSTTDDPKREGGVATTPPAPSIGAKQELDDFGLPIRPARTHAVVPEEGKEGKEGNHGEHREEPGHEVEPAEKHDVANGNTKDTPGGEDASIAAEASEVLEKHPPEHGGISSRGRRSRKNSGARATSTTSEPKGKERSTSNARKRIITDKQQNAASEWSHQVSAPQGDKKEHIEEDKWETMPAYAPFDIYDDNNKLIAKEQDDSGDEELQYGTLGGAGKGYTRVQLDDDAQSVTSMDDNTAYLFKETGTNLADEDDDLRDATSQMQATKELLTEGQRIAYVGIVRLAMIEMVKEADGLEHTKGAKKVIELTVEMLKKWSQKMMVRLYSHMEVESAGEFMKLLFSPNPLTPLRTSHD